MLDFGLGMISLVGVIIFPVIYLLNRVLQAGGAWLERNEGPKDRVIPKIIIAALLGFLIGSFAQPKWDNLSGCHDQTGNWAGCVIPVKSHK